MGSVHSMREGRKDGLGTGRLCRRSRGGRRNRELNRQEPMGARMDEYGQV
ncbi:MAG: hypothetical protein HFH80_15350 [Lachnospiraceae bacterium]|nr:hypothetical protein [Lachnospiraceae bacterium]